ncbi:glycosyltransferase [Xanthomonas citri pv. citri]
MPKISVILPTYNVEKYIAKSIQSVLNQTHTDFELIVVIDGSKYIVII